MRQQPPANIVTRLHQRQAAFAKGEAGLFTAAELCTLLNVTKQTITAWVGKGTLPCYRLGSLLRFDPGAVLAWLEARAS